MLQILWVVLAQVKGCSTSKKGTKWNPSNHIFFMSSKKNY